MHALSTKPPKTSLLYANTLAAVCHLAHVCIYLGKLSFRNFLKMRLFESHLISHLPAPLLNLAPSIGLYLAIF